ncbi:hypothetical protein PanWU01x14_252990, partial [Parasponia andersonii]
IINPGRYSYLTTKYPLPQAFLASLPLHDTIEPSTFRQASQIPQCCAFHYMTPLSHPHIARLLKFLSVVLLCKKS